MAICKIKRIKGDINNALDYILEDTKTNEELIFSTSTAKPHIAGHKWKIRNDDLERAKAGNKVVGWHFIQSFDADEVTYDQCYNIAKEWIEKCTDNKFDYVLAVHTDTNNVHAHIIVNPYNKEDGSKWNLFMSRDLKKFKEYNDEICKKNGLSTIQTNENKSNSWWKQHHQVIGDDYDTILKKTIDYFVNNVQNYEQFKKCLQNLGYEIEDGNITITDEEKQKSKLEKYKFTINEKMINKELSDENSYFVRIPFSKEWMLIPSSLAKYTTEEEITLKAVMNFNQNIMIFDKNKNLIEERSGKEIIEFWENKQTDIRNGLRIKLPGTKKFKRCKNLAKEIDNIQYDLDSVKKRIEENNVMALDEKIEDILKIDLEKDTEKTIRDKRNNMYENAYIKTKYNQSELYSMSKYQKYLYFKSKEIQNVLDNISKKAKVFSDLANLTYLKDEKRKIKNALNDNWQTIRIFEDKYKDLQNQSFEGIIDITEKELDEWLNKFIEPLRNERKKLKDQYKELEKRIDDAEKNKDEMEI